MVLIYSAAITLDLVGGVVEIICNNTVLKRNDVLIWLHGFLSE